MAERLSMTGYLDHAAMHAKHPEDEIYSDLVEVFEAKVYRLRLRVEHLLEFSSQRKQEGDRARLSNTCRCYKGIAGFVRVDCGRVVGISQSPHLSGSREYAVGIIDGQVNNVHEYQDARGFIEIAMDLTQNREQKMVCLKIN